MLRSVGTHLLLRQRVVKSVQNGGLHKGGFFRWNQPTASAFCDGVHYAVDGVGDRWAAMRSCLKRHEPEAFRVAGDVSNGKHVQVGKGIGLLQCSFINPPEQDDVLLNALRCRCRPQGLWILRLRVQCCTRRLANDQQLQPRVRSDQAWQYVSYKGA